MPEFTVKFGGSVTYQPSHPKAMRSVETLAVHAPTVQAAYWHAAKVCEGRQFPVAVFDAAGVQVWGATDSTFAPADPVVSPVEVTIDVAQVHDYA